MLDLTSFVCVFSSSCPGVVLQEGLGRNADGEMEWHVSTPLPPMIETRRASFWFGD